ncbi:MAG: SPFH domain-containing protein [Anaerolineae bacterium]|nr:SPFH domain-containing protein [Anaerolineae bacterium]
MENPAAWQNAYTRDMAYQDSAKRDSAFFTPLVVVIVIVLVYSTFSVMRYFPDLPSTFKNPIILLLSFLFLVGIPLLFLGIMIRRAFHVTAEFLVAFYEPPDGIDPGKIINNRLLGVSKLPPPLNLLSQFKYILVKDGQIEKPDSWETWSACNLGGPIMPVVFDGCALYLERGNRFSRVVGPGSPFIEWYETIKYVIDLRPKIKSDKVDVWTKDGIKVTLAIQIECRVGNPAKNDPALKLVYTYDPDAIKKAIERYAVRWPNRQQGEPSEFTWVDAAWGQVTGIVPNYIGSRMLNDLFIADRENGQILSPAATNEIFEKLNGATNAFGVFVTDFQILKIDIPSAVIEGQKQLWKSGRQGFVTLVEGRAKATAIRLQEKARADAQRDFILAIASGLEKNIRRDENQGETERFVEPLLLSFSGILKESLQNPLLRANLAKDTLATLEEIKAMLQDPAR